MPTRSKGGLTAASFSAPPAAGDRRQCASKEVVDAAAAFMLGVSERRNCKAIEALKATVYEHHGLTKDRIESLRTDLDELSRNNSINSSDDVSAQILGLQNTVDEIVKEQDVLRKASQHAEQSVRKLVKGFEGVQDDQKMLQDDLGEGIDKNMADIAELRRVMEGEMASLRNEVKSLHQAREQDRTVISELQGHISRLNEKLAEATSVPEPILVQSKPLVNGARSAPSASSVRNDQQNQAGKASTGHGEEEVDDDDDLNRSGFVESAKKPMSMPPARPYPSKRKFQEVQDDEIHESSPSKRHAQERPSWGEKEKGRSYAMDTTSARPTASVAHTGGQRDAREQVSKVFKEVWHKFKHKGTDSKKSDVDFFWDFLDGIEDDGLCRLVQEHLVQTVGCITKKKRVIKKYPRRIINMPLHRLTWAALKEGMAGLRLPRHGLVPS